MNLSPTQELWLYAHVKRSEQRQHDKLYELAKMVCTFVNFEMAKAAFTKPETVENDGFLEDLKKLDPNFDASKYEDVLEE